LLPDRNTNKAYWGGGVAPRFHWPRQCMEESG